MRFGGLVAIDDVSFQAADRQITAIIGPNGAGKTTVFNCLTGFYKPTVGRLTLELEGRGPIFLERMEGFRIASRARIARTFQNIRLFPKMTLLENLVVAQHNKLMRASGYTVRGLFGFGYRREEEKAVERRATGWSRSSGRPGRDDDADSLPMATSGVSRSRGRCAPSRCCCASTSRRPA